MASATRDHFSSRLGVLAATLGSAVGLGNIWKFPSLVGQNGGASFLVVYLLASLCIGLPLMISDLSLGRAGRSNVISIFQKLAPRLAAAMNIPKNAPSAEANKKASRAQASSTPSKPPRR